MKKLIIAALAGSLLLGSAAPALAIVRGWDERVRITSLDNWRETEKQCDYNNDGYLNYCWYNHYRVWKLRATSKVTYRIHVQCRLFPYDKYDHLIEGNAQWVDFDYLRSRGWYRNRITDWFPGKATHLKGWCDVDRA